MGTPEVIRQRRLELGLTQSDLARAAGVDTRQINRYETGATEPTLAVARRLADQLRLSMDELAGGGTPFTGTWWSAWHDLTGNDQTVTAAVQLNHRGRNCTIHSLADQHDADRQEGTLSWRAELYVDVDDLLGWFLAETDDARARGTLNLTHRNNAIDGTWIKFTLSGITTGKLALANTAEAALERLQQVVALDREKYGEAGNRDSTAMTGHEQASSVTKPGSSQAPPEAGAR